MHFSLRPSLVEVCRLLAACGLPSDDIHEGLLDDFIVARDGSQAIGVAGLQVIGDKALLRSVAVAPTERSGGRGKRLVGAAEALARGRGVKEIFLLTHDAQPFFAKLGYVEMARRQAPPEIMSTPQFGASCCAAATLMGKSLEP